MSEATIPVIWNGRLCKVVGGCLHVSRKGNYEDFNYLPSDPDAAFAANVQKEVAPGLIAPPIEYIILAVGGGLAIVTREGTFHLTGNDNTDMRITYVGPRST